MKNLKLFSEVPFSLQFDSNSKTLRFSAFDIERNRLFFLSSHNLIYTTLLPSSSSSSHLRHHADVVGTVDLEPGDSVTAFDYLMEKESLIVGTSNGLLLLYTVDTNNATQQVVGNVEGGVNCISPSPDGELLAVITGLAQILVMTHDWDLLYEMSLHDQACHVSKD